MLAKLRVRLFSLLRVRTLGSLVIAVDGDGKIVLIRNSYNKTQLALPGGGLKRTESFREGALREVREEAGIEPAEHSKIHMHSIYRRAKKNWIDHVAVFVLEGWTQKAQKSWEITEIGRFDPDDLPKDVSPSHRRRIDEWRGRRPITDIW